MKFLKPTEFYGYTRFIDSSLYISNDPSICVTIDASELTLSDSINGPKKLSEIGENIQSDFAQVDSSADSFIQNKPQEKTFDLKKYLSKIDQSTNFRFILPATYKINTLEIKEKSGNAAGYINIGSVDNSINVVNSQYVDASSLVDCPIGKEIFSLSTDTYIYVKNDDWGNSIIDLNIHLDKVME